jgi:hypothetical protein
MNVDFCDRELLKSLINNRNSAIDYSDQENHRSTENVEEPAIRRAGIRVRRRSLAKLELWIG